ncbi:cupin domain-containing protein [Streptomyces sp. NPDC007904]|uniref:cupin domain-containing protein n=1 Tax=Streptomyces sp. NPDC007904 TaxID=3364787 RepID=UPI0036E2B80C
MKNSARDPMEHPARWIRDTATLAEERWNDPVRGDVTFRTAFGDGSGSTDTFTAGIAELQPGGRLACHRHAPVELYYVTDGCGTVTLKGTAHRVVAGAAVFVPGGCEHEVRNDGPGVLRFFYTLAADSLADIEYEFVNDTDDT